MSLFDKISGKVADALENMVGGQPGKTSASDFLSSPRSAQTSSREKEDYLVYLTCTDLDISLTAQLPETWQFDVASEYSAPYAEGLTEGIPSMLGPGLKAAGVSLTTQVLTAQMWKGSSEVQFSLPLVFQAESDPDLEIMLPIMQLMYLTLPRDSSNAGGGLLSAPGPHFDLVDTSQSTADRVSKTGSDWKTVAGNKSFLDHMKDTFETGKKAGSVVGEAVSDIASSSLGAVTAVLQVGSDPTAIKRSTTNVFHTANNYITPVSNTLAGLVKNKISLSIGNMLHFDSVVVTSVSQSHKVQPSLGRDGNPSGLYQYCEVNVTFKTFFTPTQKDLIKMFPSARVATEKIRGMISGN